MGLATSTACFGASRGTSRGIATVLPTELMGTKNNKIAIDVFISYWLTSFSHSRYGTRGLLLELALPFTVFDSLDSSLFVLLFVHYRFSTLFVATGVSIRKHFKTTITHGALLYLA